MFWKDEGARGLPVVADKQISQFTPTNVVWANQTTLQTLPKDLRDMQSHWSRVFEYPWVMARFKEHSGFVGVSVLDAGGGDGPLQFYLAATGARVINVDLEGRFPENLPQNVVPCKGDITKLPFQKDNFDVVTCVSVLEHMPDPFAALDEMWRVLKPGGRLIVTFDVASHQRWNHAINEWRAREIISHLPGSGFGVPPEPVDVMTYVLDEHQPLKYEPPQVLLRVLCFYMDKPQ